MTDEQKAVEELADRIGKFYNYQITQSDTYELAKFLYIAGYRKQSETVKEFAEKLKTELFANCVIIQTIYNPQKEDMDSSEAFQIINEIAEKYGKEE